MAVGDAPAGAWSVPAALDGERVDRAVALLTGLTRARVAEAVAAGQVRVAGRPVRRSRRVRSGERVDVDPAVLVRVEAPALAADPDVSVAVVWEDRDVLVVDKPAGLVVHPGAGQGRGTLVQGLLARYPDLAQLAETSETAARPGIVHRLDRGTSGLLVVARNAAARQSLVAQLAGRTVERCYQTLVWGALDADEGLIDAPLGRSDRDPTLMGVRAGGRSARTHYHLLGRASGPAAVTLLECRLETGRTHQIRVHLA
ncbi:MAG: RluA family pseudouridine synthase, partial [Acidimicrobiales bacterium]